MLCHGQGDLEADPFDGGCCWVNGQVCPNRWYIENGSVFDSNRTLLGTVDDVARSFVGNSKPRRERIVAQVQGAVYICSAAVFAVDADPSILTDRAQFDTAWAARPEYQPVADAWEAGGKPRNWCQVYGPGEGQCCFSEDQATNDAKAGVLDAVAVTVRRGATGAS